MRITKALSLKQPWCWLILNFYKDVEIRAWNTKYRGFIALHAGKTIDNDGYDYLQNKGQQLPLKSLLETGAVLGVAYLHDVIEFEDMAHYFEYRRRHLNNTCGYTGKEKGFILQEIRTVEPIPMKGRLNLFNVEIDVEAVN